MGTRGNVNKSTETIELVRVFKQLSYADKNLKLQKIFAELGTDSLYQKAYRLLQQDKIDEITMVNIYEDIMETSFTIKKFKGKLAKQHKLAHHERIKSYLSKIKEQEDSEKVEENKELENLIQTIDNI